MQQKIIVRIQEAYAAQSIARRLFLSPMQMRRLGIPENALAYVDPDGQNIACVVSAMDRVLDGKVIMPWWLKTKLNKRVRGVLAVKLTTTTVPETKSILLELERDFLGYGPHLFSIAEELKVSLPKEHARTALLENGEKIAIPISLFHATLTFTARLKDPGNFLIAKDATVEVKICPPLPSVSNPGSDPWNAVGGLESQKTLLRRLVELPFKHPEVYTHVGIPLPHGILLKGTPGCGKSLLAKTLALACNATLLDISPSSIMHAYNGESEKRVKEVFSNAHDHQPAIILFDEIDALFPNREGSISTTEGRVIAELFKCIDSISSDERIVVIGTTNRPGKIDAAARRPGRFEYEILVPVPDEGARKDIFAKQLAGVRLIPSGNIPIDLAEFARMTRGFSGADINSVIHVAALKAIERDEGTIYKFSTKIPPDVLAKIFITRADIIDAINETKPSTLRGVAVEIPRVPWDAVGGLEMEKQRIIEATSWMTTKREPARAMGIRLPKGILLHGPPGTGKTLIGKAIATQGNCNFIAIRGPELLSKWVGESEENVRNVFQLARTVAPCVLFFDEFDAIAPRRSSTVAGDGGSLVSAGVVAQLLAEMDGLLPNESIVVIASTNRPERIDPALLRKGRIDRVIEIPLPDEQARAEIFAIHLHGKKLERGVNPDDIAKTLAAKTSGFSGADIEAAVMEAGINALRHDMDTITKDDLERAVDSAIIIKATGQGISMLPMRV